MFVVFVDKPYYPYVVDEFTTQEEAERSAVGHVPEGDDEEGPETTVYVAQVITKTVKRGW